MKKPNSYLSLLIFVVYGRLGRRNFVLLLLFLFRLFLTVRDRRGSPRCLYLSVQVQQVLALLPASEGLGLWVRHSWRAHKVSVVLLRQQETASLLNADPPGVQIHNSAQCLRQLL